MTELSCAVLFFFVCGASALHDWSATPIKLAPDDLLANTYFGYSVAIDGEYAVVGAPMLSSTGVAYAFKRSGNSWDAGVALSTPIEVQNTSPGARFGQSVSIKGIRIVVGAPDTKNSSGLGSVVGFAYIYQYDGYTWQLSGHALTDPDKEVDSKFGHDVSISERSANAPQNRGIIVVGAIEGLTTGSAFVFQEMAGLWDDGVRLNSTYNATTTVLGEVNDLDEFGKAVAVYENVIVVGDPGAGTIGINDFGAVFMYECSTTGTQKCEGWIRTQIPTPSPSEFARFGSDVAISKGGLVIGGEGHSFKKIRGNAYAYRQVSGAWTTGILGNPYVLDHSEIYGSDLYGTSVDIDNDLIIVGSRAANATNGTTLIAGKAHIGVYEWDNSTDDWTATALASTDPQANSQFGFSVGISGSFAIVGKPFHDSDGTLHTGEAYVFTAGSHGGLSTGAIIGIAVGAAVFASLLVLFVVMRRRKSQSYTSVATVGDAVRQLLPPSH